MTLVHPNKSTLLAAIEATEFEIQFSKMRWGRYSNVESDVENAKRRLLILQSIYESKYGELEHAGLSTMQTVSVSPRVRNKLEGEFNRRQRREAPDRKPRLGRFFRW